MVAKVLSKWFLLRDNRYATMSVCLLIFQGTALALTLRLSRINRATPYLSSVAVVITEFSKLLICFVAWTFTRHGVGKAESSKFRNDLVDLLRNSSPLIIPAGLFVFQQVLVIVAASNLDAVTFEIFGQSFMFVPCMQKCKCPRISSIA